mmetsp:Transcript_24065/g.42485  ORF Transcript_24065/g.42485 Transcript_24065/m.42485 type:complete len:778 (-) Transcript_24065:65-2398(-)
MADLEQLVGQLSSSTFAWPCLGAHAEAYGILVERLEALMKSQSFKEEENLDAVLDAHMLLAQYYVKNGQVDRAQGEFEEMLKIDPKSCAALVELAEITVRKEGGLQKSLELLEQAKKERDTLLELDAEELDEDAQGQIAGGHQAAYTLALAMAAANKSDEANEILKSIGFCYRLADEVFQKESSATGPTPEDMRVSVWDQAIDAQMFECVSKALEKETYWAAHDYDAHDVRYFSYMVGLQEKPRNSLEALIIEHIWPLVKQKDTAASGAVYAEYWAHRRGKFSGHQLHYDLDEKRLRNGGGANYPLASTVLYLEPGGASPTLITGHKLGATPPVDHGALVFPSRNRLAVFDGSLLHGVVPRIGGDSSSNRLTFMVGFWGPGVTQNAWEHMSELGACMNVGTAAQPEWFSKEGFNQWPSKASDQAEPIQANVVPVPTLWTQIAEESEKPEGNQKSCCSSNECVDDNCVELQETSEDVNMETGDADNMEEDDDEDWGQESCNDEERPTAMFVAKFALESMDNLDSDVMLLSDPTLDALSQLANMITQTSSVFESDRKMPTDEVEEFHTNVIFLASHLEKRWTAQVGNSSDPSNRTSEELDALDDIEEAGQIILALSSASRTFRAELCSRQSFLQAIVDKVEESDMMAAATAWNLAKFPVLKDAIKDLMVAVKVKFESLVGLEQNETDPVLVSLAGALTMGTSCNNERRKVLAKILLDGLDEFIRLECDGKGEIDEDTEEYLEALLKLSNDGIKRQVEDMAKAKGTAISDLLFQYRKQHV